MRVVIIGAGGHGRVVCDALKEMARTDPSLQPVACLDDDTRLEGETVLGIPVLGSPDRIGSVPHDAVVVAVGDNRIRRDLYARLVKSSEVAARVVHPGAILAESSTLGAGSVVCAGVIVNACSSIGANVILNTGSSVDHHGRVGDHAHIAPGVCLGGRVTVGEGSLVGIGATVVPGTRIGAWAVIGAGSLVRCDVPDGATALGVPARFVEE